MIGGLGPPDESCCVDGYPHDGPGESLLAQHVQGIALGLLFLCRDSGHLSSLPGRQVNLIHGDGGALYRVGPHHCCPGCLGRIEVEVSRRAGQSQHGQGSLAGPEGAFHQA
jgi:hypothetical protein